jgi:hypothetical protein
VFDGDSTILDAHIQARAAIKPRAANIGGMWSAIFTTGYFLDRLRGRKTAANFLRNFPYSF